MIHRIFARHNQGLTLIETLLYIALSSLIIAGVLVSAYPILTGANYLSKRVVVESEVIFVLRKIAWALGQGVVGVAVSPDGKKLTLTTSVADEIVIASVGQRITVNNLPITAERIPIINFLAVYTPKVDLAPAFLEISFVADETTVGPARYNLYF